MTISQSGKRLLKIGGGMFLLILGAAVGIFSLFVIEVPGQEDAENLVLQDSVNYILKEQKDMGIDCHALRTDLLDLLRNDISPNMKARQIGQEWNIGPIVRDRMGKIRDHYFACGRLYSEAQRVKWGGLNDVRFVVELDSEIATLNTLIRFGDFGNACDASCLGGNFRKLQEAVEKIETALSLQKTS